MPFGKYTFAKSPYIVISWSRIITKCGPRDAIGWRPSEDAKCYSVFGLVFSPFAVMLVDSWLPSSPVSRHCALGSSNLPVRLSEKVPVQEKHEFSEPIWQTTGLGRVLALRTGREEAENVTGPSAGRRFQLLRKHGEAGHLGHAEAPETCPGGGEWGGDRQWSVVLPSHSPHNLITNHLRIWESRPVARTVWESSFLCLVSPESPASRKLWTLDFLECWKEHTSWWAQPLLPPLQEGPWVPYWNLQNFHIFSYKMKS